MSRLSVLDTLASITSRAHARGVHLEVIDEITWLYLLMIERRTGPKGAGREVMLDLCEYADRRQVPIMLLCENEALASYYQSIGFRRSAIQARGLGIGMERMPG